MYGSHYANPKAVKLLMKHSVARKIFSPTKRKLIELFGPMLIKTAGFPVFSNFDKARNNTFGFIGASDKDIILDAGCGYGMYAFELSKKAKMVIGVDIQQEDIELANKIKKINNCNNINFHVQDITNLEFKNEYFNKILFLAVIEHIKNDKKALKELNRVLKRNGLLVIAAPSAKKTVEYKKVRPETKIIDGKEKITHEGGILEMGITIKVFQAF